MDLMKNGNRLRAERGAMLRVDRGGYKRCMAWAKDLVETYAKMRKLAGSKGIDEPTALWTALLQQMDADRKCRVVIEYNPAEERVAAYTEPLHGQVKQFTDDRGWFEKENQSGVPERETTKHPAGSCRSASDG